MSDKHSVTQENQDSSQLPSPEAVFSEWTCHEPIDGLKDLVFSNHGPPPSNARFYHLSVSSYHPPTCSHWKDIGVVSSADRSPDDWERAIEKAKSGSYHAVLLTASFVFHPLKLELIERFSGKDITTIFQISSNYLEESGWDGLSDLPRQTHINFLIEQDTPKLQNWVERLEQEFSSSTYTIFIRKSTDLVNILQKLPSTVRKKVYFSFPYKLKPADEYLNCVQVIRVIKSLRKRFPDYHFSPFPGIDTFDPRISPQLELEPVVTALYQTYTDRQNAIDFSVIIPSYNNRRYLLNTVKHVFAQDYPAERFEIIVVDDGSNDMSDTTVLDWVRRNIERRNFRYIYAPRPAPRRMGDAQYRSGIARNLGVKSARGQYLAFLDSDILTPKNYLTELKRQHASRIIIQTQRHYLKDKISDENTVYSEVQGPENFFIPEKGYWHNFYEKGSSWPEMIDGWKYVCTYGLSLPTDLFKRIGWFRKNYLYYGFEDTDLGYRLIQAGYKLHLSDLKVFHLYHKTERSEFFNSQTLRDVLLAKTAKVFFHNTLDTSLYDLFPHFLQPDFSPGYLFRSMGQLFRKQPRYPVVELLRNS